jgi:hypothetical protein
MGKPLYVEMTHKSTDVSLEKAVFFKCPDHNKRSQA